MFERLRRGWTLTKASLHVLRLDPEMIILPVLSGVIMLLLAAALLLPMFLGGADISQDGGAMLAFFALYFAGSFVAIFFNTAVVHMATMRFEGKDPIVRDGLSFAAQNVGRIFVWAMVAATVGLLLRMFRNALRENLGFLGSIFGSLLEMAWGAVIYFAVPILVYNKVGPFDAMKQSWALIKRTWGETVAGEVGMSLVFVALGLLGLVAFFVGISAGGALGLALLGGAVLWWVLLMVVYTAAQGILTAALYRYATTGQVPQGFDQSTMQRAVA